MRQAARWLPALLLALAACRPEDAPLFQRGYQPLTEYHTTVVMSTVRSLHQETAEGKLLPDARQSRDEIRTTQRLRFGPAADGACPVELEMLDYRVIEPEQAVRMDLAGCVGLARYELEARRLAWLGLKDTTWQARGQATDPNFILRPLSAEEAASYLASTVELLNSALADSARRLVPGQGWNERRRQETRIGPFPVAWSETRRVTTRELAGGQAFLEVAVELVPEAIAGGPPVQLEGAGKGRIDFDLARRFTALSTLQSSMTIEVADSALTWIARSETTMEIRTTARPWSPAR